VAGSLNETRLPTYQSPSGFVEVRHDIAPASIAVAGDRLPASATIRLPTVKDHDVPALADEFSDSEGARFRA
jgi:hypothetical protein